MIHTALTLEKIVLPLAILASGIILGLIFERNHFMHIAREQPRIM